MINSLRSINNNQSILLVLNYFYTIQQMSQELVENLNSTVSRKDDFNCPCLNGWTQYERCKICSVNIIKRHFTGNGTTAIDEKIHAGLKCPHCGTFYCSYEHMCPKILVDNSDEIDKLTGLKSYIIYQICAAYLSTLPLLQIDDPLCDNDDTDMDCPYCYHVVDYAISNIVGFDVKDIDKTLFNEVRYEHGKQYEIKPEVVQFINIYFTDSDKYLSSEDPILKPGYFHDLPKNSLRLISVFCGCQNCANYVY